MNRGTRTYVAFVVLLAAAAVALAGATSGSISDRQLLTATGFVVAILLVQLLPVPFPRGAQLELVSVEEAVVVPLVLLLDPFPALVAVVVGALVAHLVSGADPLKAAFNVAQLTLSVAAALGVVRLLTGEFSPGHSELDLAAAVAGLLAMFIVNQLLVAGVMRLASGTPMRRMLLDDGWVKCAMWAANAAIGMLLVLPAFDAPALLLVALVPLVMLNGAWRVHAERSRDEQRLRELGMAVSSMAAHGSLEHVAERLADAAREVVDAGGAEVRLFEADRTWWSRRDEHGEVDEGSYGFGGTAPTSEDAGRVTYTVPLGTKAGMLGEMSVWIMRDRDSGRSFSRRDRGMLEMLAHQAATAIDNAVLVSRSQVQQRTITQVFDHSSEGMFVLDRRGRVRGWNPAMRAISGFELSTVDASPISLLSPQLAAISRAEEAGTIDAVISTADGERRHVRASYAPIEVHDPVSTTEGNAHAEEPTWVVVVRDVTAEQETERLKDDFVATVSHELRTPLTAIKGFLETMRRDDIELGAGQVRMFLQIMGEQADRLERLIGDLLDMSAIESGRPLEVELTPVDLGSSVSRAVTTFSAGRPEVEIDMMDPDAEIVVDADSHRLEQVLTNLLDNARKHGGLDSTVGVRITRSGRGTAQVLVTDQGPGISAVDQRRIFERFFVAADSVTRNGGGAGLGLYICHKLVTAMGGRIDVRSRVGDGATFIVELPIRAEALHRRDNAPSRVPGIAARSVDVPD